MNYMKFKFNIKNKKKAQNIALGSVITAGLLAVVGVMSSGFQNWNVDSWFKPSTKVQIISSNSKDNNEVKNDTNNSKDYQDITNTVTNFESHGIKMAYFNEIPQKGDVTSYISYTVEPEAHTGTIVYAVTCPEVESYKYTDYLEITHDEEKNTLAIKCLKAFTHQFILKIYSEENPSIYGQISIDYKSKLLDSDVILSVNSSTHYFDIDVNNTLSGGSISIDDSYYIRSFAFKDSFIEQVKQILNYESISESFNYHEAKYFLGSDPSIIYSQKIQYDAYSFIHQFYTQENDNDSCTYLTEKSADVISNLFDGINPVFTITWEVGSGEDLKAFTRDVPWKIDSIAARSITPSNDHIIF